MIVSIEGPVDIEALVVVGELGSGGQGRVRLVEAPGIFAGQLAFKEYDTSLLGSARADVLDRLVALPASADEELRTLLAERTAWPVAVVRSGQQLRGFLMPPAPPEYTVALNLPGDLRFRPLAMEFLLNPIGYMSRVGLRVSERNRLELLREFARMLAVLHGNRIVVGDLSAKNVLVTLDPPRCFLLDCDAVCLDGESVTPQVETPDWRLPEGEPVATEAGDRYKFGLLVVRLLLSDQTASDPDQLTAQPLFAELAELAAGNRQDPPARPQWGQWLAAFDKVLPLASDVVPVLQRQPEPSPTADESTPPAPGRSRLRRLTVFAGVVVTAVCVLLVGIANLTGGDTPDDVADDSIVPAPTVGAPTMEATARRRDRVGLVKLAGVDDTADVIEVAEFFDDYFQAVNDKDWDTLLSLYDPAGVIDPAKPASRASFTKAMSTTEDTDIALVQVESWQDPVRARVTFTSTQAPGYGPKARPDETCTRWDLTLALTGQGGDYRLLRPIEAEHQPC